MTDPAYPSTMERDLREAPVYREVESFFRRVLEPGFAEITDPSDPQPSPDGRWIAFRGERRHTLDGHPDGPRDDRHQDFARFERFMPPAASAR
jgi:hypothetical protein